MGRAHASSETGDARTGNHTVEPLGHRGRRCCGSNGAVTPSSKPSASTGVTADELDLGAGIIRVVTLLCQQSVTILFGLASGLLSIDAC